MAAPDGGGGASPGAQLTKEIATRYIFVYGTKTAYRFKSTQASTERFIREFLMLHWTRSVVVVLGGGGVRILAIFIHALRCVCVCVCQSSTPWHHPLSAWPMLAPFLCQRIRFFPPALSLLLCFFFARARPVFLSNGKLLKRKAKLHAQFCVGARQEAAVMSCYSFLPNDFPFWCRKSKVRLNWPEGVSRRERQMGNGQGKTNTAEQSQQKRITDSRTGTGTLGRRKKRLGSQYGIMTRTELE